MSAYMVNKQTLQEIVGYLDMDVRFPNTSGCYGSLNHILVQAGYDLETRADRQRLIQDMAELNRQSVNIRYGEHEIADNICYEEKLYRATLIQVYKSLQCYLYQCCEGEIPETSNLYKALQRACGNMAHCIVSRLPEYEQAAWGH